MLTIGLRNQLRRSLFLIALRLRSRGEDWREYIARKGVTDICIDGYPRSANSFSVRMFRQANPGATVAHHTHSIANLRYSIKHAIPTVVLIRQPLDAIASSVIAHKDQNIELEVSRYVDFYDWVAQHRDRIVMAEFNDVIHNMNAIIGSVNQKFKTSFSSLDDVAEADAQVKQDIEQRFDRLGQNEMSHIKPIPTKSRDEEKMRLRVAVENHSGFARAQSLYDLLTATPSTANH
ncbi:MAG: hypothetical protein AB8G16_17170 [Gammaproteobacteria bacterium]